MTGEVGLLEMASKSEWMNEWGHADIRLIKVASLESRPEIIRPRGLHISDFLFPEVDLSSTHT